MANYDDLRPLFEPRSVAVVGVSRSGKQGAIFVDGLKDPGFKGNVYIVHPSAEEIMGIKAYPSISALPERPDLAVLVLPWEPALRVVKELADAGVPGATVFTAGFNELGTAEGDARAEMLLRAANGKTRLIGPNGMGIYNPTRGLGMFGGMPTKAGGIGLISQSGSLVSFLTRAISDRGLGFSKAVSMGNQLDLNAADYLEYFADDPETTVICGYIEGVPDGHRFKAALMRAAAAKPVILWKAGRVAAGAKAARSHTGQLAGDYAIWQALARQAGAVLVRDAEELVDTVTAAHALTAYTEPGKRFAIIAGPGGPAVSASDACEEAGLSLAELSAGAIETLAGIIAAAGTSPQNPIDVGMVLVGATEHYGQCLRIALDEPTVDAAIVIGLSREDPQGFARMLAKHSRETGKPVLFALNEDFGPQSTHELLADTHIATAPSAERALRAYARVVGA